MEKKDSQDNIPLAGSEESRDPLRHFTEDFGRPPTALEQKLVHSFAEALDNAENLLDADFTNTIELLETHGAEYEEKLRETITIQFLNPLTPEERATIEQADTKENSIQLHTEILERKWGRPLTDMQCMTVRNIWTDQSFLRNGRDGQEMINFLRNWRTIGENVE